MNDKAHVGVDREGGVDAFRPPAYALPANFATEPMELEFDEFKSWADPQSHSYTIPRNGDLLRGYYLKVTLPRVAGTGLSWVDRVGLALIDSVTLEIGGQVIDCQTGDFMHIWNSLTSTADKMRQFDEMISATPCSDGSELQEQDVLVPLTMPVCNEDGGALPLLCLRFHEVKVVVKTRALRDVLLGDAVGSGGGVTLVCDMVAIDTNERRKLAQGMNLAGGYRYLVPSVQSQTFDSWTGAHALDLVGECSELVVVCRANGAKGFDFSDGSGGNPVRHAAITCDGRRALARSGRHMNCMEPYRVHTGSAPPGVNVISFALRPEQAAPSGVLDMTHTREIVLRMDLADGQEWCVTVYARTYALVVFTGGTAAVSR